MALAPVAHIDVDVAIVGSGFSGSLTALALLKRGLRVALVERGRHPRFAIGESSTPLANLLLEELADRYDLPRVRVFSKWGTWQRSRPDVAVGLKRGFTFFFHEPGHAFADDGERSRQLLVAASPHDEMADTHWYRPDFDQALAEEAASAGAVFLDEMQLDDLQHESDGIVLEGVRHGRSHRLTARFVVDASGPRGFLQRALRLEPARFAWLPATQGLYTHFEDVARWDALNASGGAPPYPVDDAAVHHVFPGGWIWVLRFNNGITSAGAALTDAAATGIGAADGAAAWDRLLAHAAVRRVSSFARRGPRSRSCTHRASPSGAAASSGPRWALLPSAAGVIDPLLSTGFPLTLLGIQRLVELLTETSPGSERDAALAAYESSTFAELNATERLVAALYATMHDPPLFKQLALLYFAAASFSEAARRLGRPGLAPGFLLHLDPTFGSELADCSELAAGAPQGGVRDWLFERIALAIEPFDIAGLLDRSRRHWHPVLAADLVASAAKLRASAPEIERLLERSGFTNYQ